MCEEIAMPWDWPVTVNYHESKAYAKWKGPQYRIMTEAEHHAIRDKNVKQTICIYPIFTYGNFQVSPHTCTSKSIRQFAGIVCWYVSVEICIHANFHRYAHKIKIIFQKHNQEKTSRSGHPDFTPFQHIVTKLSIADEIIVWCHAQLILALLLLEKGNMIKMVTAWGRSIEYSRLHSRDIDFKIITCLYI